MGAVEILIVASCYRNKPDGPLGSHADFTLYLFHLFSVFLVAFTRNNMFTEIGFDFVSCPDIGTEIKARWESNI